MGEKMDSVEIERALMEKEILARKIQKKDAALEQIIVECDKWTFVPLEGIARIAKDALCE